MQLKQGVLVVEDLDRVVEDLTDVFELEVCFRDPAVAVFGIANAILPVGDTFLEVVSPVTRDAPARRYLDRHGGDGGYMIMIRVGDLGAYRPRLEQLGVRVVWQIELDDIAALHLHPADLGGAILSLDAPRPLSSWRWAGPDWANHVRTSSVDGLAAVEIMAADPLPLARRWAALLGTDATEEGGRAEIVLDSGRLRFCRGRRSTAARISGVELSSAAPGEVLARARRRRLPTHEATVEIGGVAFRLVASPGETD